MFFDSSFIIFVLPAFIFAIYAQMKVSSTFKKYSKIANRQGRTGQSVARLILDRNGLSNINIEMVQGELTDHYDPKAKVLRLSESTYASNSVAAIGVAAHEAGHAIQHNEQYVPLLVRNAIVPLANFGSMAAFPLVLIGMFFGMFSVLIPIGILLFTAVVIFQLVTLPVEFNASRRAVHILSDGIVLEPDEVLPAKKVLNAAAMTYVAAAAVSIGTLLRLIFLSERR